MRKPIHPQPQLTLGGQEAFELRNALLKAVEVIRTWHDQATSDGTAWRIYFQHSPEMKEIREALERHA